LRAPLGSGVAIKSLEKSEPGNAAQEIVLMRDGSMPPESVTVSDPGNKSADTSKLDNIVGNAKSGEWRAQHL